MIERILGLLELITLRTEIHRAQKQIQGGPFEPGNKARVLKQLDSYAESIEREIINHCEQ